MPYCISYICPKCGKRHLQCHRGFRGKKAVPFTSKTDAQRAIKRLFDDPEDRAEARPKVVKKG